jgi:hypothetical protein
LSGDHGSDPGLRSDIVPAPSASGSLLGYLAAPFAAPIDIPELVGMVTKLAVS